MRSLLFIVSFFILLSPAAYSARNLDKNLGWYGETFEGNPCNGASVNFGPFDFTDPEVNRPGAFSWIVPNKNISIRRYIDGAHFTTSVEQLVRGKKYKEFLGDIDYTLRAIPNHHRALWAMARYNLSVKAGLREPESIYRKLPPPECYFQRAKVFAPEDKLVSAVFGIYLHRLGRLQDALAEYKKAEAEHPKLGELAYNMGLLYLDMNDLEKAHEYADRARLLGYPLTGLQNKLQQRDAELLHSSKQPQ